MGMAVGVVPLETYHIHQTQHLLAEIRNVLISVVCFQRLRNDVKHAHPGVQRGIGVLKNHLDIGPDHVQLFPGHFGDLMSFKVDLTAGFFQQPDNGVAGGGFSAAGLAHDTQRLTRTDRKADIIYSPHILILILVGKQTAAYPEILFQMAHFQQVLTGIRLCQFLAELFRLSFMI